MPVDFLSWSKKDSQKKDCRSNIPIEILHSIDGKIDDVTGKMDKVAEKLQANSLKLTELVAWKTSHKEFDAEKHRVCENTHKCVKKRLGELAKERKDGDETLHKRIGKMFDDYITPLAASVNMGKGGFKALVYVAIGLGGAGTIASVVNFFR